MHKFSVIVLLYNSEKASLCRTLDSILCQKGIDWELILADDGSDNSCLQEAQEYLMEKRYNSYKVKSHEQNVGTVQNIFDAMECVEGKYVKCIGAGDLLFDDDTLKKVYDYMERTKSTMCFGKMQAFHIIHGEIQEIPLFCPTDIGAFRRKKYHQIEKNIIRNHGWIPGASMFYHTAKFKQYLGFLTGVVRYCEDLLQVILLLQRETIVYLEEGTIYYEVGSGISTNTGSGNSERMQQDHGRFWKMIMKAYPDNRLIKKGYQMYQYECIPEQGKRQMMIITHNIGYVIMLFKTFWQRKYYHVGERGMLYRSIS